MANEKLKAVVLAFVCDYMDCNGYAPSYREIQQGTGIRSVSTVHDYVKRLEAEGRLELTAGRARALASARMHHLHKNTVQRVRVEVADGGVLFLDCAVKQTDNGDVGFTLSGIMDASQLKGMVGSIVGCRFEEE